MSFSSVTIEGKRAAPDRIYYNGTVVNNSTNTVQTRADPNVVFQDQRQTPLVPDSSGYVVSVQNFSLNGVGKSLPLFIPQIAPPVVKATISEIIVGPIGGTQQILNYTTTVIPNIQDGNQIQSFSSTVPQDLLTYPFLGLSNITVTNVYSTISFTAFTVIVDGNPFTPGTYTPGSSTWNANLETINDITTTIYNVTVGVYDGSGYNLITRPIIWEPEDVAATVPQPNSANPVQAESAYYYCYTYTHWVSLVNKALLSVWTTAGGGTIFGTQCPFMEYDETTGLFSINQDSQTCMAPYGKTLPPPYTSAVSPSATSASGGVYQVGEYSFVGMNTCLEVLFSGFNSIHFGAGRQWNNSGLFLPESVINMGLSVELLTGSTTATTPVGVSLRTQPRTSIFQLVNPFAGTPLPYAFFARLPQDFVSTGGCWSPIASFVLGTAMIPVRNEAAGNPISFGTGNLGAISNSGVFQKVLIEAPIDAITADYWKGWVLYEPKIETYSSLDPSHEGISDIDIHLYWRNRLTNSLISVTIPNQASMSFRLLFKKKVAL